MIYIEKQGAAETIRLNGVMVLLDLLTVSFL